MYGKWAGRYAEVGVVTVPANDKRPRVKAWRNAVLGDVPRFVERFGEAPQLAMLCGPVTVVDIDDISLFDYALERFGNTPVKSRTPSGGRHLWYAGSGQRRRIKIGGLDIDVLGLGGIAIVPPSPAYAFIEGEISDIPDLPVFHDSEATTDARPVHSEVRLGEMREGDGRNNRLWKIGMDFARTDISDLELGAQMHTVNGSFAEPLDDGEAEKVVRSVLTFRQQGKIWARRPRSHVYHDEMDRFSERSQILLLQLRRYHGHRKGDEFILANALAEKLGWSGEVFVRTVRELDGIAIEVTNNGGHGKHDPRRARLLGG